MEKLTEWNENGHAYYPVCFEEPCNGMGCQKDCDFSIKACDRLAAYEDTGLTPEEIVAMKQAMMGKLLAEITAFEGVPIYRLCELAEADKKGRLVVLPCKVGDTVYSIEHKHPLKIDDIVLHRGWIEFQWVSYEISPETSELYDDGYFEDEDIGKTVFLTPEETQAALEEENSRE